VPVRQVDRHVDRDGSAHGLDPVNELEEFLVGVVAILIGHGRIERQINGQQAVPLYIADELGIGQIVIPEDRQ
jgi:hypothetical protein